jgi:hypothetical protein
MSDTATGVGPVDRTVKPEYCGCVQKWNAQLMPKGRMIVLQPIIRWDETGKSEQIGEAPLIKLDTCDGKRKGRAPTVYGKFCPFCGARTVAA